MRTFTALTSATPERVWRLYARPSRWSAWAPHLAGAWGLGDPEVRPGARGAVRLLGVVPVPTVITEVVPGERWGWRVGPVTMMHHVQPQPGGGSEIALDLGAPGPLEAVVAAAYGPVIELMLGRLARVAASA